MTVTNTLFDRLAHDDAAVRRLAVIEAADLEDETWLPSLAHALRHDANADVRRTAAQRLGAWDTNEAVDALCAALTDSDAGTRDAAAESLTALKDPAVGERLLPHLADADADADAFKRAALLRALRELRLPDAAAPALTALSDASPLVRREAVGVLGWLRHTHALERLTQLAHNDTSADVRHAAVGALGFATDDSVLATLTHALSDEAWRVREEAAATLGKLRLAAARDALERALADEYWQVTLQAARTLGRLRDVASTHAVSALLTFPISNVRKEAALALGELGNADALAVLEAALGDGDPEVRKAVRIAIAQIGERIASHRVSG
ncbi:HEAT repeat domain-containing protein [Caballeronia novacaledonica]|uniref:HEAT repeat domain-containing protein n=1 Tax=Caballeronia novacaledonica TaxID=1544861 RepID=A0ACB5QVW9_9BURK|nr:HEAT repeat domain-containing protein [Caballeronia novacaledonica]